MKAKPLVMNHEEAEMNKREKIGNRALTLGSSSKKLSDSFVAIVHNCLIHLERDNYVV